MSAVLALLRGSLAAAVLALNTLLIALALLPPALLKLLLPSSPCAAAATA